MNIVEKAAEFAKKAHEGQKRRDGKPYFTHVEAVAKKVDEDWFNLIPRSAQPYWNRYKDHVVAAAFLHDCAEDCGVSKQDLLDAGFSEMTAEIVDILTKKEGENYFDFIMRIHNGGGFRTGAVAVKLSDLWHNMNDNAKEGSLLDKYRLAEYILSYFKR
jgi:(p)ppGpp synthase/HD superfamily hydrolase